MGKLSSACILDERYFSRELGGAFESGSSFQVRSALIEERPKIPELSSCGNDRMQTISVPWNYEVAAPFPAHVVVCNDLALSDAHTKGIRRFETQESRVFLQCIH